MDWQKILKLIPTIRRPVALAGLVIVVLYGIYKLILTLPIFSRINDVQTFALIDRIALYLFILALVAIVLSIFAYLGVHFIKQKSIRGEHATGNTPINNSPLDQLAPMELPQLTLKLFLESGAYQDEITFIQPQPDGVVQDYYFAFGLALQNEIEKSVPAKDIDIRVEISWNGEELQSAPEFTTESPGWQMLRSKIQQSGELPLPAVLEFKGTEQNRCTFGHPLEWNRFRGHLSRKTNGYFLLCYRISSASPHTANTDKLRITLQ